MSHFWGKLWPDTNKDCGQTHIKKDRQADGQTEVNLNYPCASQGFKNIQIWESLNGWLLSSVRDSVTALFIGCVLALLCMCYSCINKKKQTVGWECKFQYITVYFLVYFGKIPAQKGYRLRTANVEPSICRDRQNYFEENANFLPNSCRHYSSVEVEVNDEKNYFLRIPVWNWIRNCPLWFSWNGKASIMKQFLNIAH